MQRYGIMYDTPELIREGVYYQTENKQGLYIDHTAYELHECIVTEGIVFDIISGETVELEEIHLLFVYNKWYPYREDAHFYTDSEVLRAIGAKL